MPNLAYAWRLRHVLLDARNECALKKRYRPKERYKLKLPFSINYDLNEYNCLTNMLEIATKERRKTGNENQVRDRKEI